MISGDETRALKVASYNIRKCVGLDWQRDPRRVLSVIKALDADIVALQEADKRLGNRPTALPPEMIAEMTDMVPVVLDADGPSLGFHGNAVLVRKSIEVSTAKTIELPALEPRGAVMTEFNWHGTAVRIVGLHLGLTRTFRRQQLASIVAVIEARSKMPTVLMGDFNEWSLKRGVESLAAFDVLRPGLSFHTSQPIAALDRIAISDALGVLEMGVFGEGAAARASDHFPIWAELQLR